MKAETFETKKKTLGKTQLYHLFKRKQTANAEKAGNFSATITIEIAAAVQVAMGNDEEIRKQSP